MLLDGKYGPPIPGGLTAMPQKKALYSIDTYFWEGWEDLVAVVGQSAEGLLFSHSLVLLKPDSISSRKIEVILQWLRQNNFAIVACVPLAVTRHQIRSLWQYQWNTAPRERKEALESLLGASASLLLIVRSLKDTHISAAQRFAELKGPADSALQRPSDLRALLGSRTHLISFVHAADEPADVVRELAILLPEAERKAIFTRLLEGKEFPASEALELAVGLYESVPQHSLDLNESLQRVEIASHRCIGRHEPDFYVVTSLFDQIRGGAIINWRELFMLLDRHGAEYERWDRITITAHMANVTLENVEFLIPGPQYSVKPTT